MHAILILIVVALSKVCKIFHRSDSGNLSAKPTRRFLHLFCLRFSMSVEALRLLAPWSKKPNHVSTNKIQKPGSREAVDRTGLQLQEVPYKVQPLLCPVSTFFLLLSAKSSQSNN